MSKSSKTRTKRLATLDREALVTLIEKMLDRYPDLESLLEMPLPGASGGSTLDPVLIRRQVSNVLDDTPYEWNAAFDACVDLGLIANQGDDYAEGGEWRNAAIVYRAVAEEILDSYDELYDDQGEFLVVVADCASDLARCLDHLTDEAPRTAALQALFDIYMWEINFGGSGYFDEITPQLLAQTTAVEKEMIADWARENLPASGEDPVASSHQWRTRALGGFLLQLEAETLDDKAYLQLCRQSGRTHDLVARLLQLERVDEAVAAIDQGSDYELLPLCDLLRNAGHQAAAETLLWKRIEQSTDNRVAQKLLDWVRERDEPVLALDLASLIYTRQPSLSAYQQLRETAQRAERWETVKAEVLATLSTRGQSALLITIYLDEGDVDAALETLRLTAASSSRGRYARGIPPRIRIAVAKAAEETRPQAAVEIYLSEAQRLINARGRQNYAEAAKLIVPVRRIFEAQEQQAQWHATITRIREENRNLPALRDELDKAGL